MNDDELAKLKLAAVRSLDGIMAPPVPRIFKPDPPAKWMRARLIKSINEFEATLSSSEEIGGRIVNCPGPENTFHISDIIAAGSEILIYRGRSLEDRPVELLQHYTQVSILLIAIPVEEGTAKRIGFDLTASLAKPAI